MAGCGATGQQEIAPAKITSQRIFYGASFPECVKELSKLERLSSREDFHPKGDGGSGRRPLPPGHLTFW